MRGPTLDVRVLTSKVNPCTEKVDQISFVIWRWKLRSQFQLQMTKTRNTHVSSVRVYPLYWPIKSLVLWIKRVFFHQHLQDLTSKVHPRTERVEYQYSVDLVIFACLNFREFMILGLFTKFRIREFSIFFSSAIVLIISWDSWIREFVHLAKFAKVKIYWVIPDLQYIQTVYVSRYYKEKIRRWWQIIKSITVLYFHVGFIFYLLCLCSYAI